MKRNFKESDVGKRFKVISRDCFQDGKVICKNMHCFEVGKIITCNLILRSGKEADFEDNRRINQTLYPEHVKLLSGVCK